MPQIETIHFPHIFLGDVFAGVKFTKNHINAGIVELADLNLTNRFFGGNVENLGKNAQFGVYVCKNRWNQEVLGIYVHDEKQLTDEGWELIRNHKPDAIFAKAKQLPKVMTPEQLEELKAKRKEAIEAGVEPEIVNHSNINELISAIKVCESGESDLKLAEVDKPKLKPAIDGKPEQVKPVVSGNVKNAGELKLKF